MNNALQKINQGRIAMRPKWHFIATKMLYVGCILVLVLTAFLAMSFIFFALRASGAWFAPSLGPRGWYMLVSAMPWILLILGLIAIALLELLLRKYSFAYRRPLLYTLLGVTLLTTLGAFAAERAHMHKRIFMATKHGRMKWARPMYRTFGQPRLRMLHRGMVQDIMPSGFTLHTQLQELLSVTTTTHTRFPQQLPLGNGMNVVVLGPRSGMVIQAIGIRIMKDIDE